MDETTGDAGDEELVVNEELDNRVELLIAICKHAIELLGLRDGTGETIKNEPVVSEKTRR